MDFVSDIPELSNFWDNENDGDPCEVSASSHRPASWVCGSGHQFSRSPRMMRRDSTCPSCGVKDTSIATKGYGRLWNRKKNGDVRATDVPTTSSREYWWKCAHKHEYMRAPVKMLNDASCPHCALVDDSLAAKNPAIAAQWHQVRNGEMTPDRVAADHNMAAWWECDKGHEFKATVRNRAKSNGLCPRCFGSWSIENLRSFVKSLAGNVTSFNGSELMAVAMGAGVLSDPKSKEFVMLLCSGRFPPGEVEAFGNGGPIPKPVNGDTDESWGGLEHPAGEPPRKPKDEHDPNDIADIAQASTETDGGHGEIDIPTAIATPHAEDGDDDDALPEVQTRDALTVLDSGVLANADTETVGFLLDSAKAKLWNHAFVDAKEARAQADAHNVDVYGTIVRDRFLGELDAAQKLELPKGYSFRPTPEHDLTRPHLMQCHVAVCVSEKRRFGNWSGMGAGKTLSAILATRVVGAKLTVICCPNSVVQNWKEQVFNAFRASEVIVKTWTPTWKDDAETKPRYLILNYEQFQLKSSESNLVAFLKSNSVDFVVIDEIHFAKQRKASTPGMSVAKDASISMRKRMVQGLVVQASKGKNKLCVLGMSGTPVINNLREGKSLIEMITGHHHDDLETKPTVQNCMRLYQKFVTLGTRYKPNYGAGLDESQRPEIDCTDKLAEIRATCRGNLLQLENMLTRFRLPTILENLQHGTPTIIYTHYVDGIVNTIVTAVRDAGFTVETYVGGDDDTGLLNFKQRKVEVLVASSRIGTGVDGLQRVCHTMIINTLPWTSAEYDQLKGRLWRTGQDQKVKIIVPITFAIANGERWSYCQSKIDRIEYKRSIADAAVDGVVPQGVLRTPAQAQQDIVDWLVRLTDGDQQEFLRLRIEIPLSAEPHEVERRMGSYGDFSAMNNRWNSSESDKTHTRLTKEPEEWSHYHTMYRKFRETWTVVPFEEEIRWLQARKKGQVIADFGCGEALLAKEVGRPHVVHSFDHVAIDHEVVACNMSSVPLSDESLDLAVFSLSLMGTDFTEYIREARRCLRLDGRLHIWEATSRFDDIGKFCEDLGRLGFEVTAPETHGKFTRIHAIKTATKPDPTLKLRFRSAVGGVA